MDSLSLDRDDVVNIEASKSFIGATTFTVSEVGLELAKLISEKMKTTSDFGKQWGQIGIPCRVLQASHQGWTKGKVRITLEFIPDEPIEPASTDAVMGGEHRTDQH